MKLTKELNRIKADGNRLTKYVVDDILEQDAEYREGYIKDVLQFGCISGAVSGLTYYTDTAAFYDKYTEEIWDLLEETRSETGERNIINVISGLNGADDIGSDEQFKSLLAWFGYEVTMNKIEDILNS